MLLTIHQPEHMPWVGYFHKMAQADCYVLLDSVQFKKNNWQNRNRIMGRDGSVQWLTVPIQIKGHIESTIAQTPIQNDPAWQRKYLGRIHEAYRRHPHFSTYIDELEGIIQQPWQLIVEFNMALIEFFRRVTEITTPLVRSSTLPVAGKSTDLLVAICTYLKAAVYLSGPDGRNYLDLDAFAHAGVGVEYHKFTPPVYPAPHFAPGLSMLDLVMNHGPDSRRVLGL